MKGKEVTKEEADEVISELSKKYKINKINNNNLTYIDLPPDEISDYYFTINNVEELGIEHIYACGRITDLVSVPIELPVYSTFGIPSDGLIITIKDKSNNPECMCISYILKDEIPEFRITHITNYSEHLNNIIGMIPRAK